MAKKTENEVKETKKEAAVMDEAAKEKFQQKLKDLLALAKKKKNMLEYQEISDFFAPVSLQVFLPPRTAFYFQNTAAG